MLLDGILDKIGFNDEQKAEYEKYKALAGEQIERLAHAYMKEDLPFMSADEKMGEMADEAIHKYTLKLLFLLECTGYVYEKYQEAGLSDKIFYDTMKDIKYKLDECVDVHGIFGDFTPDWFDGFFKLKRFAFGRLQFDITAHKGESVNVAGREVNEGDFIVKCHIPSSGPLFHEECMKSYKAVYDFVKSELKDDILPIECHSWLLFPNYQGFFGENSNTKKFAEDYTVFDVYETDIFWDKWRIFGKDAESDPLPQKTILQRNFAEYVTKGKPFGYGKGIFLFNGEKIIK
ncbi:MAG: hypothetical protein E7415_06170 [Ruminococcaceae bacterium]|nr:hypothetical protein [Oscillospiraceae bacterium]